jgi:anion-transporting  ArsA/GET3 family ATPase
MMLDQKRAFDEIVERYAKDAGARERIFRNPIYRQISSTLTGSHEYAAMAKLYSLALEERYDLIVLDTPPTANALDFLDSPEKLADAIDSPAVQWLIKPYLESGHFSIKLVGLGGAFILKRMAKFVGSQFLEDMAQFVFEFNTVLGGFRERAREVFQLLRRPDVSFALVCSPDPLTVDEALAFHGRLVQAGLGLGGFVVNRVHPRGPEAPGRGELIALLEARDELRGFQPDDYVQAASDLDRTYADFQALADIDATQVGRIRTAQSASPGGTSSVPVVQIPLFDHDIYDVAGLSLIGRYLFA